MEPLGCSRFARLGDECRAKDGDLRAFGVFASVFSSSWRPTLSPWLFLKLVFGLPRRLAPQSAPDRSALNKAMRGSSAYCSHLAFILCMLAHCLPASHRSLNTHLLGLLVGRAKDFLCVHVFRWRQSLRVRPWRPRGLRRSWRRRTAGWSVSVGTLSNEDRLHLMMGSTR